MPWYLADLLMVEEVVEHDGTVRHERPDVCTTLIEAADAEAAYVRSCEWGRLGEMELVKHDDERARTSRFLGVQELTLVMEPFEHGSELRYERLDVVPAPSQLTRKVDLAVFRTAEEARRTAPASLPHLEAKQGR
jgi:hypothetical protein